MKLIRLLELHQNSSTSTSLATNFGDGYLLKYNRIYQNIRNNLLAFGYQLSDGPNSFYQALPLSQLDALLTNKKIPFTDNVSVLLEIEAKIPNSIQWNDIIDNLKPNHIFHESCHGMARENLELHLGALSATKDRQEFEQRALRMLIEESFANCCELLAVIDVHDQVHRIFFELNSYTHLFEERAHFISALKNFGHIELMKFLLLSYLHANFLHESLDERQFTRVLNLSFNHPSQLNPKDRKTLKALSKIAFRLDLRFRLITTSFYLRLSGIPKDMTDLLEFDFLARLESNAEYMSAIHSIVKNALHGIA